MRLTQQEFNRGFWVMALFAFVLVSIAFPIVGVCGVLSWLTLRWLYRRRLATLKRRGLVYVPPPPRRRRRRR